MTEWIQTENTYRIYPIGKRTLVTALSQGPVQSLATLGLESGISIKLPSQNEEATLQHVN